MNLFTAAETANNYVTAGVAKTKYSIPKMLVLGILAGLLIGFPSCVTEMATFSVTNTSMVRMISGLLFAFGLGTVILTGAELFTGNTLITMSLLDKKVTLPAMLKNWLFVYIGNFLGSMLLSAICAYFGWLSAGSNALAVSAMKMAVGKMTMPFQNAFFMGVLCNILVTIGVLMSLAGKDGTSRFIGAWVPVMFFVTCGFNHSIADMTYCMLGLFAKNVTAYASAAAEAGIALDSLTWGNYFVGNLIPVTLGNILGGVAVGVTMWYAYVRKAAGKK
ncbi:MAG TPA: formate/nitrite transporter family protein [Candidatus Faecousia excrementipullorum]|nr:formate/nitrite transporter family protein [Candidatus Faecousia excrementipullorum]